MDVLETALTYDHSTLSKNFAKFEAHFLGRNTGFIPRELFSHPHVWLEIGCGTGTFFTELAKRHPEILFLAVERDRMRAKTLVKNTTKLNLPNLKGYRGNVVPALLHGVPDNSVEKLFILYPCPWPKPSQRKNRWYLHPIMPHLKRVLKPGGTLVWASDQKFYIDEAEYICRDKYKFQVLHYGEVTENIENGMSEFPDGRSKFERTFIAEGHPVYELILRKDA